MAQAIKVVSADDHVIEPADLWTSRLPRKLAERGPRVARQPDGADKWVVDGKVRKELPLTRSGALSKDRYRDPTTLDQLPKAGTNPAERLRAMDSDGIAASVLYPNAAGYGGEVLCAIPDPELEVATIQAYNDWMIDTWGKAGKRFVPQCIVPVSTVDAAIKEAERSVKKGHRGIVMPCAPWLLNPASPHLYEAVWDPFWTKVTELGVPIGFHSGSAPNLMLAIYEGFSPDIAKGFDVVRRPSSSGMVVCRFLFSGIGERFPKLKVVFSASGIDWVPFMLEVADHERERICRKGDLPYEMDTAPSDIFHRQCHVTTWFDKVGMRLRTFIGVDNILFGSEFPLETSSYPNTQKDIEKNFEGVPDDQRKKMLADNTAKLYKVTA